MQLGILEPNHSKGVRGRAHMMCRGMTDLSPDSGSSAGPEVEEDPEPENEDIATHRYVGPEPEEESVGMQVRRQQFSTATSSSQAEQTNRDEQFRSEIDSSDGYFTSSSLPGRSLAMPSAGQEQQNDEDDDDEIEDSEAQSLRRMRYIYAGIEEVSDPEYWQELHHFSSNDEASNSEDEDNNNDN